MIWSVCVCRGAILCCAQRHLLRQTVRLRGHVVSGEGRGRDFRQEIVERRLLLLHGVGGGGSSLQAHVFTFAAAGRGGD